MTLAHLRGRRTTAQPDRPTNPGTAPAPSTVIAPPAPGTATGSPPLGWDQVLTEYLRFVFEGAGIGVLVGVLGIVLAAVLPEPLRGSADVAGLWTALFLAPVAAAIGGFVGAVTGAFVVAIDQVGLDREMRFRLDRRTRQLIGVLVATSVTVSLMVAVPWIGLGLIVGAVVSVLASNAVPLLTIVAVTAWLRVGALASRLTS